MWTTLRHYYDTVKYLKGIQLYGRVLYRFKKVKIPLSPAPSVRQKQNPWIASLTKPYSFFSSEKTMVFLNQEKDITSKKIWSDATADKLWLYNLHYFDVLQTSAPSSLYEKLIARWIDENPPGVGCGWEPYPISLRLVNWIKWIISQDTSNEAMLQSLALQARYLSRKIEFHIQGNHLLANAKGLLFAGLFFEGKEAESWFQKGWRLYQKELKKQILPDGGHFELSPMYHAILLEDLLDVMNLFQCYGKKIPDTWYPLSDSMFAWLKVLCHEDGEIAFFNDATLKVAATYEQLQAYRQRIQQHNNEIPAVNYLEHSGYCRIKKRNITLLADVGHIGASYQPGHAHADTLSFELSLGKQRIIVNSGISSYNDHAERLRQRGSAAHNTLLVNHENSSRVWKSFRVGHRAQVRDREMQTFNDHTLLRASHDGYYRSHRVIHTRTWKMHDDMLWIEDEVQGKGHHTLALHFHFHPDILSELINETSIVLHDRSQKKLMTLYTEKNMQLIDSAYHPAFNISIPTKKIVIEFKDALPTKITTRIDFHA